MIIAVNDGPRVHWSSATAMDSASEGQKARFQLSRQAVSAIERRVPMQLWCCGPPAPSFGERRKRAVARYERGRKTRDYTRVGAVTLRGQETTGSGSAVL